ncbi:MAG TPA: metallophosphoesterase [Myxococcota bacterium]|nr:metallophosphoesterase [Myxococcota bacterium]HRY95580.1 metallophosphoesterase [Myxococcota bacterium]HSA22585.1 metallophosphoesterase [Myxococcota bacterium]
MARRYLIVSDLHLFDPEDHPDGWMAHKSSRYTFDREFAELLADFGGRAGDGDEQVLVLNGDVLDFDLVTAVPAEPPWPVSRSERKRGLRSTAVKSAWKAERILAAHPGFVQALAGALARGWRVVYVLGNHDRELHFEPVRAVLCQALRAAAGGELDLARLQFEPWFYYQPGEVYVEHGEQYDYYSSFKNPLCPTVEGREGPMLALPMGNLSNRYLMTQMGFFNPFAADFILDLFSYFWHWLTKYAFSRRSLFFPWLWGSLVVMGKLLHIKKRQLGQPRTCPDSLAAAGQRSGLPVEVLERLLALQQPPITNRFFRVAREFWIDRLVLALLMVGGTVALALVPIPLWVKLMVPLTCFPLVYLLYEALAHGKTIFSIESEAPLVARQISALLPARIVSMGHDHVPRLLPIARGVVFVDTGTWAPILSGREPGGLASGFRNYLRVTFEGADIRELDFGSWMEARPEPRRRGRGSVPGPAGQGPDELG